MTDTSLTDSLGEKIQKRGALNILRALLADVIDFLQQLPWIDDNAVADHREAELARCHSRRCTTGGCRRRGLLRPSPGR